ncbi:MAG: kynureninase [Bacteroidetes bacterium]|nr:kynureninase [Bacteroidota bacterium]
MIQYKTDLEFARKLDATDPNKTFRTRFYIPENNIYMDGNSLGLLSKDSEVTLHHNLKKWKTKAINGWLEGDQAWFYYAEEIGKLAAPFIGAEPGEVIATGSTTVNLHALLSTFFKPKPGKNKILTERINFPSDIYAIKSHLKLHGLDPDFHLVMVQAERDGTLSEDRIIKYMDEDIALALFQSVIFTTSQLLDVATLTQEAHKNEILIGFDCSHSAGVVPHAFDKDNVDFAFWCGYKYLNGGPGSSAFIFINKKHFEKEPLMAGWFGYKKGKQFEMSLEFDHERSAGGWQISSPGILGLAPLEGSLKILNEAGIEQIRAKSTKLTSYFIYLIDQILVKDPYNFYIGTPRDPEKRGGHIALKRDTEIRKINEALKSRGIISDFRPPNIIRVAPAPLYNTFQEVWEVVYALKEIIDEREYMKF